MSREILVCYGTASAVAQRAGLLFYACYEIGALKAKPFEETRRHAFREAYSELFVPNRDVDG